jgi:citronellyl-CoA dehydrogenase
VNVTPEHEALRQTLKRFIDAEVNPHVDRWEEAEIFPARDLFRKMGALGLLGLTKPTEYGGMGLDWSFAAVMAETLGHVRCGGVPMAIGVHTDMATPALAKYGSPELCREFLAPAIAGELVSCIAVSETGSGSDVASIRTFARKDGGDYVIDGSKMWITSGTQADFACLLANTSEGAPHRNKSLIIVPLKTRGVSVAKKIRKIGMHSSHGVQALQNAVDQTIAYTRERKAFGRSILDNQWVHFRLAEYQTEIEALRALTYQAVDVVVAGGDATRLASMAKLKVGRLMREVIDGCLQFWGGMGYASESDISRLFRDGRLTSIGAGADEVMLQIICKYMGTLPGGG